MRQILLQRKVPQMNLPIPISLFSIALEDVFTIQDQSDLCINVKQLSFYQIHHYYRLTGDSIKTIRNTPINILYSWVKNDHKQK